MALYAKLALRNVFRNRRRTLITLAAMGFGAAAIIVFGGFVHSIYYGVRESTIRSQVGHIQIYRKGYSEKGNLAPFDYLIADYPALRDELRRLPHVKTVTARLGFSGLVSTGDTTTAFVGSGVVPEGEMDLSALAVIVDGKELATREPRGITLGVGLARAFGVKPGDDLMLLTTTKAGAINALAVKVRGVWESGEKAYDDRFLRIGLPETQRVLDLEGGEVQSVVLLLDATDNTARVRESLERLIRDRGLDLEIKTWEDLALRYHQVRELFGRIFAVLTLIVSIMVVFGITNTMTMAIFERTREIGTVMALGTRRRGVVSMFVLEASSSACSAPSPASCSAWSSPRPSPPSGSSSRRRRAPRAASWSRSSSSPRCWRRRSSSRSSRPRWPRSIPPGALRVWTSWRPSGMCRLALTVALTLVLVSSARADEATDLVREADRARRPADSFVWKISITSQEAKKAPSVDGFEVFVKGGGRVFVKFVAPPRNVGRSLLALGRDLWIYLPDAGKPVRIPLSQRLVGQVANGDIARADYAGDYDATLRGEEAIEGVPCHVLDLNAKTKDVTYAVIKYWVASDGRRP